MKRRVFIRQTGLGVASLSIGIPSIGQTASVDQNDQLTILHTNDMHGQWKSTLRERVEAIAAQAADPDSILLLDAGGSSLASPYRGGEAVREAVEAMNAMGYAGVTLGPDDMGGGLEALGEGLSAARFAIVQSNYDWRATGLAAFIKPYHILERRGIKIGLIGLGPDFRAELPESMRVGLRFADPVRTAEKYARYLRRYRRCDLVVVLSQLGFWRPDGQLSDLDLARQTSGVDLILGGGSHTYLDEPVVLANAAGREVVVHHAGYRGELLGQVTWAFTNGTPEPIAAAHCYDLAPSV